MSKKAALCITIILNIVNCIFCAGKLSVTKENFYVISSYGTYAYAFAKVENVGDKPIKVNAGLLEIFDEEGNIITSSDYIYTYASYIKPGEYTYVKAGVELEDPTNRIGRVGDYTLTVTGKNINHTNTIRLPCETDLQLNVGESWWPSNYMYALITNDTDAPLYGIQVVFALLDEGDNVLYIDSNRLYSSEALTPGSSMIFRNDISSSFIDYFKANNLTAVKVDAIAFVTD